MTISGFTPLVSNPSLVPGGTPLAGSNPLLAGSAGSFAPTGAQLTAMSGADERPGIAARLVSAMKAAIGELRGQGASESDIRNQVLAMQAQTPVTLAKRATTARKPAAAKPASAAPAHKVVHAKTWKTLATHPAARAPRVSAPAAPMAAPTEMPMATQVPSNATQLPNATVYSYDQNGHPVAAPTMAQLGMNPTMLQGLTGMAQAADPDGPQLNATNQTNLSGLGTGLGLGIGAVGSPVPVLGAPIIVPGATPAATVPVATAPTTPHNGVGANQQVTNRNATDIGSRNEGVAGYGSGYGASPWDPTGGVATPYSPYGSSMTGAYALGGQKQGFFGRLFG